MKRSILNHLFFACLLATIFISCGSDKKNVQVQTSKDFSLKTGDLIVENARVISTIKGYIKDNGGNKPSRVYTMLVQRKDLTTTIFQLSSIISYSELYTHVPSGYFTVDEDLVLVYNGLEQLCKKDEAFFKRLESVIGERLEDDLLPDGRKNPDYRPVVYDPSVWEVKISEDSVNVKKGVRDPFAPPLKSIIKFVPPKVK